MWIYIDCMFVFYFNDFITNIWYGTFLIQGWKIIAGDYKGGSNGEFGGGAWIKSGVLSGLGGGAWIKGGSNCRYGGGTWINGGDYGGLGDGAGKRVLFSVNGQIKYEE